MTKKNNHVTLAEFGSASTAGKLISRVLSGFIFRNHRPLSLSLSLSTFIPFPMPSDNDTNASAWPPHLYRQSEKWLKK